MRKELLLIVAITLILIAIPSLALGDPADLEISNGVIKVGINENNGIVYTEYPLGTNHLGGWMWPGYAGQFAFMYTGLTSAVWEPSFTPETYFPSTGVPDEWYTCSILYEDPYYPEYYSVRINKSVYVPSGAKFFYIKYEITNNGTYTLTNFRFFQYVNYYVDGTSGADYAGYDTTDDFVYQYENRYVGFKASIPSSHHEVNETWNAYWNVYYGTLNNQPSYGPDDCGVALQFDLGDIPPETTETLTITFGFGDSLQYLRQALTPVSCENYLGSAGGVDFYTNKDQYLPGEIVWIKMVNTNPNYLADFYLQISDPSDSLALDQHITIAPGSTIYAYFTETTIPGYYGVKAFNVIIGAIDVGSLFVIPEIPLGTIAVLVACFATIAFKRKRLF